MKKRRGFYPPVALGKSDGSTVSSAGAMVLTETIGVSGLGAGLSMSLARWRKPLASHTGPLASHTGPR